MQSHFSLGYDKPATPVKGDGEIVQEKGTYRASIAGRIHTPLAADSTKV
jgi:hypothetical protein